MSGLSLVSSLPLVSSLVSSLSLVSTERSVSAAVRLCGRGAFGEIALPRRCLGEVGQPVPREQPLVNSLPLVRTLVSTACPL